MNLLYAFLVGVVVGLVVYFVAGLVPFLAQWQTLLAVVAFLLAVLARYRGKVL